MIDARATNKTLVDGYLLQVSTCMGLCCSPATIMPVTGHKYKPVVLHFALSGIGRHLSCCRA